MDDGLYLLSGVLFCCLLLRFNTGVGMMGKDQKRRRQTDLYFSCVFFDMWVDYEVENTRMRKLHFDNVMRVPHVYGFSTLQEQFLVNADMKEEEIGFFLVFIL
ncbi:hypothetical protein TNCV_615761 [Trichonephila clavipes]|nr:hypothetical protein TNCV_615761 [Trichonephila clavipes]